MHLNVLKGMKDVLPNTSYIWQYIEELIRKKTKLYGYKEIRTPVLERTELFLRGVGDTTDIVTKEMYTFLDKGGRSVTLKPEGTAGAARAFIESGMYAEALPSKLYYLNSPTFRYEAPQSGRLREHHQFGVEMYGGKSPSADAEVIALGYDILTSLGLENVKVSINSIGCQKCRPKYTEALKGFLHDKKDNLCHDCNQRLDKNPLRVIDCKNDSCSKIVNNAPVILDYLCDECKSHFEELQSILKALSIPFEINPKIVRGLDYYTKTVFEFVQTTEHGKLTVCGGGRYDNLLKELGAGDIPAVGFGLGLERLIMLIDTNDIENNEIDYFICSLGDEYKLHCNYLLKEMRANGLCTEIDHAGRSLKAQFKYANKINAKYVILVGGDEYNSGCYKIRNLNTREEVLIEFDKLFDYLRR